MITIIKRIFQIILLSVGITSASFANNYNMPYGVTPVSHQIYDLHMATFWICCAIGVLVYSALFYTLFKYRKSKGAKPAHFHENILVEIIWTTIPFLILVGLAIPATMVLQHIHNTDKPALNIKIVGYQWKWKYVYLDQGISFYSDLSTTQEQIHGQAPKSKWFLLEVNHPLVVPIHQKIRLLVTANDVIHSWWVPELGVKQDAVPGYVNENWTLIEKPGIYRGQCGELCGANHGFMPIVVKAVTQLEFQRWVAKHKPGLTPASSSKTKKPKHLSEAALLTIGKKQYETHCAMCHQNNGQGLAPTFPALKGSAVATGPLKGTIDILLNGRPGTAMQAFRDQLNDEELAGVITFVRHAWGNDKLNKGHDITVQPKAIAAAR